MFNPQTLSPQGAENEDEENEGEDGEKGYELMFLENILGSCF